MTEILFSSQRRRRHIVAASERRLRAALPTSSVSIQSRPIKREAARRRRQPNDFYTARTSPKIPHHADHAAENNSNKELDAAAAAAPPPPPLSEISLSCSASTLLDTVDAPPSPPPTPAPRCSTCPILIVSQQKAAPIEQTFHAIAHSLVAPEIAAYPAVISTSPVETTRKCASVFVHRPRSFNDIKHQNEAVVRLADMLESSLQMTRADRYDMLQQLQQNACSEPSMRSLLERESERVYREYRCLLDYQRPMMESIRRCTTKDASEAEPRRISGRQRYQLMRNAAEERTHSSRIAQLLLWI